MRQRSTVERRHKRYEFIAMYKQEFEAIIDLPRKHADVKLFIEKLARPLLEYSKGTYYADIFSSLRKDYKRLIK